MKIFFSSIFLLAGCLSLFGQRAGCDPRTIAYQLTSGRHSNDAAEEVLAYSFVAQAPDDINMLRVRFSQYSLGAKSYILLTSMNDGHQQKLDATTLKLWYDTSAIFNGGSVRIDLFVGSGDVNVYAEVDQLVYYSDCLAPKTATGEANSPETLCGADSRVASTDNRVGRIAGCTAWMVSNGAVLTAGHCGPLGGVFEVNVPASSASGIQVASAPADQYPINIGSVTCTDNGGGEDWCVFGLNVNATTGGRPHIQHGFFRMSRETPGAVTMRITGFGVDNSPNGPVANCCAFDNLGNCTHPRCNAQSRTLQTSTGTFVSETVVSANAVIHRYAVDTEPANSGSPIIWEANGFAIGIHTNGGCNSDGTGSNSGTSFESNTLETALQNFPGTNTRYVDFVTYPNSPAANGTIFQPFDNVVSAAASVPTGGRISLVEGSYPATGATVLGADGKSYGLIAPVGTVTIGQ